MKNMLKIWMLACVAVSCCVFGAKPDPSTFVPDLSTSDILLPHLKRMPLSGWWMLKKVSNEAVNDHQDAGTVGEYFAKCLDESDWYRDLVPNDIHTPFIMDVNIGKLDWDGMWRALSSDIREWGGIAWYRKTFVGPEREQEERAILIFEEVLGDYALYVNGEKIGEGALYADDEYRGSNCSVSYDITDIYLPGEENIIAVRLYNASEPKQWGRANTAGLTGLVYLDIRPPAYTDNVLVTTRPDLHTIEFDACLRGNLSRENTSDWTGEIFEWKSGKIVGQTKFGEKSEFAGMDVVSAIAYVEAPHLWSPESPFLYGIRIFNRKRQVTGVQRFGIRTFAAKDGNFELNGKPIFLRGLCADGGSLLPLKFHGWLYASRTNPSDICRKFWQVKAMDVNVNHIRAHSAIYTRLIYDICDELGLILTDELQYHNVPIENPTNATLIAITTFDDVADANGNLWPEYVEKVKKRVFSSYSHPCIATYSLGNEIRQYDNLQVTNALRNLYDVYHAIDKQNRPVTSSSGRFWKDTSNVKFVHENDKLDYADTHDYTGTINNLHIGYCESEARKFADAVAVEYGHPLPVMNGETAYFNDNYQEYVLENCWESTTASEPNWDKYLYILDKWSKERPDHGFLAYHWFRNIGTKATAFSPVAGVGYYTERNLEAYRKLWPDYDGYENIGVLYYKVGDAWPFDGDGKFTRLASSDNLEKVNAPAIIILDDVNPNHFAGEEWKNAVYAINNAEHAMEDASCVLEFITGDGNVAVSAEHSFGRLASNEKKIWTASMMLPEISGKYRLSYRLYDGDGLVNDRELDLNLRRRDEVEAKIQGQNAKVALYETPKLSCQTTADLLERLGVEYCDVKRFDGLKDVDVLIIGAESIDQQIGDQADAIRQFVEQGGRLLVFEQTAQGRLPFLPEIKLVNAGPGQFAEIARGNHPALKSLTQGEFLLWNQPDKSIYRLYLTPLSRAALLIGGDTSQWGCDNFGMVAAHLKVGQGDILLCQAEVTKMVQSNPSAGLLARQLLTTMLDENTRCQAREFVGHSMPKIKPLRADKAKMISLADAANMAFADEEAYDGKGGWTDQGKINDLYGMPLGKHTFCGVPFDIVNPETNDGCACLVNSDNPSLKFTSESKEISVNAKAKSLYFLHSGAWLNEMSRVPCGKYVVSYADGAEEIIPLIAGDNIGDWWNMNNAKENCETAWSFMNRSSSVGLYLFNWKNPRPDVEIISIRLKAENHAVVGLVGLTAEIAEE